MSAKCVPNDWASKREVEPINVNEVNYDKDSGTIMLNYFLRTVNSLNSHRVNPSYCINTWKPHSDQRDRQKF